MSMKNEVNRALVAKKYFRLVLMALVGIVFAACEGFGNKQTEFFLKDLQGHWVEDGKQVHMRYLTESADSVRTGYLWGYSWDEGDNVYEEYVIDDKYGNGWFMYQMTKSGELLRIEQTSGKWVDIPLRYILDDLTDKKMTYHPKEYPKEKVSFTKQPEEAK